MYGYDWTVEPGIYKLGVGHAVEKEIRPVFKEELDHFGFDKYWEYPDTNFPLLWAEGIRRYIYNGENVAEIQGGSYYSKPKITIKKKSIKIEPIDINLLWDTNFDLMKGMIQTSINFIRKEYEIYSKKGHSFVVAFSGGKDSLLLLDLVSRALPPDAFSVIFSNTGMELKATLDAVEAAKKRYPQLHFYEAKSHMKPQESWKEFGPPGRRLRWCCAVHKSVPTIIELRKITGNYNVKAVVFDGVRAAESSRRSKYGEISVGAKNINQVNCSPVYKWNTAEEYLYLLKNNLILNEAYRKGLFRVGCAVCPLSSNWWNYLANYYYGDELKPLLSIVEDYANCAKQDSSKKYIESGGWTARMGGRDLKNGGNRVFESIVDDRITFVFSEKIQDWRKVTPILGSIVGENTQKIGDKIIYFEENDNSISYWPYSKLNRRETKVLRGVMNKVAYCIACAACTVQCPMGAFELNDGKIMIREDRCTHCGNCVDFTNGKGCLVAKSLGVTGGANKMEMKGMNRYNHFGLRMPWVEHFFDYGIDCFGMNVLGNLQYNALRVWLQEAELLESTSRGKEIGQPLPLAGKLKSFTSYHPMTWAVIWTNLAYRSVIIKWYMKYAPLNEMIDKNDLVGMIEDSYSQSTRNNAITSVLETLRTTPIGRDFGQGVDFKEGGKIQYIRTGWESPDPYAILYSLYKWAEVNDRYAFTLSQMDDVRKTDGDMAMDPVTIYGLNPDDYKSLLQELALHFPNFIAVSFVRDLDNVKLYKEITSMGIVDAVLAEEGLTDEKI